VVALWIVHSYQDQVVQFQAQAREVVLGQNTTLTMPLSTQWYMYKWILENLMLGVTLQGASIPSRGV